MERRRGLPGQRGALLGGFRGAPGSPKGALGAPWGVLEGFWGAFGAFGLDSVVMCKNMQITYGMVPKLLSCTYGNVARKLATT